MLENIAPDPIGRAYSATPDPEAGYTGWTRRLLPFVCLDVIPLNKST